MCRPTLPHYTIIYKFHEAEKCEVMIILDSCSHRLNQFDSVEHFFYSVEHLTRERTFYDDSQYRSRCWCFGPRMEC